MLVGEGLGTGHALPGLSGGGVWEPTTAAVGGEGCTEIAVRPIFIFEKEHVLILVHYTDPFTNKTPKKRKITKKFKTPVHLPQSLQRSVRRRRRSRFPIVVGHQSQTPQGGGRRGGLTSRRISRVHCLPGASANSRTHDASFDSTAGNPSKAQIFTIDHLP